MLLVAAAVIGFLVYTGYRAPESQPQSTSLQNDATALRAGDQLPIVRIMSLSGQSMEIRPESAEQPVLMFVFSPACPICTETLPTWNELYEEARAKSIQVVGISVLEPGRTSTYKSQNQLPWDVYCFADQGAVRSLGINGVPFTFLVEQEGKIQLAVDGRLTEEKKKSLSEAIQSM